ncbi:peptidylprolyl isomerase [Hydrogenophaga sp.]|uniref:peptidylprolyl isomerase n=1 Tax=Hydrogenophaga sp. TaxID=1904254 RepID=UPI0035B33F44
MTEHSRFSTRVQRLGWVALLCLAGVGPVQAQALKPSVQLQRAASAAPTRTVDYIVALVNSEPVTNFDVRQRVLRVEQQAAAQGRSLPPREELVKVVLEQLVVERALVQQAGEQGIKVDEASLAQAEQAIAAQNQMDVEQFRRRVVSEGLDPNKVRNDLRNQLLMERMRDREINARVQVSEADIDAFIRERRAASTDSQEMNLGHVLIAVPEGASETQVRELQAKAQDVTNRLRQGGNLAALAREFSQGTEAARGGAMGMRPVSRLPELFVNATKDLPQGGIAGPLRSPAGFHVLQVIEKRQGQIPELSVVQTHAHHILLRPGAQMNQQQAVARLAGFRQQILGGQASFEDLARQHSQDGSARQGGDLGWVSPGQFVPEFEQAMNALQPGEMSPPVVSRFGVHLIRLDERRQAVLSEREQRDIARDLLREQKSDEAIQSWTDEVRNRAFVEYRDAPQL